MGVHHAWGRTYKDLYQRFHAMLGEDQRYQNGFDCQGLWVEVNVERDLGFTSKRDIEAYGIAEFVTLCKQRVLTYAARQTEQSIRLGMWMDWNDPDELRRLRDLLGADPAAVTTIEGPDGPVTDTVEMLVGRLGMPEIGGSYFTFSNENNDLIWGFLAECHRRGWLYKGHDTMPWCARCGTGISQTEMNEGYQDREDPGLTVRFPLLDRPGEALLVWTTTPWTLTSNVAAAVGPALRYVRVRQGDDHVLARQGHAQDGARGAVRGPRGGRRARPGRLALRRPVRRPAGGPGRVRADADDPTPYEHVVVPWTEVGEDEGTGIVHIAPGCGAEDFQLGKSLGLPVVAPLDEDGIFLDGFGCLTGRDVRDVAEPIVEHLKREGRFYRLEPITHRYPHCWRCGTPLVFRLVDEWFISMGPVYDQPRETLTAEQVDASLRYQIMDVVDQIRWIPDFGYERELDWLRNMHDWMISKKRYWGLALPIYDCAACGTVEVIGGREELQERAVEGWETFEGHTPHRPYVDAVKIACPGCGAPVERIRDVGNPWLDAGIVPFSTLHYREDPEYWEQWFPADFITESFPGQFRNWFYSMLAMSTVLRREPPFKTIFGYALLFGEDGRPMHKSWGNAIEFDEAAERMGVDVMRWMFAKARPEDNILFGWHAADEARRELLVLWNVYAFFVTYARLAGWTPGRGAAAASPSGRSSTAGSCRARPALGRDGRGAAARRRRGRRDPGAVGVPRRPVDLVPAPVAPAVLALGRPGATSDAAFATLHEALVATRPDARADPAVPGRRRCTATSSRRSTPDAPDSVHLTRWPTRRAGAAPRRRARGARWRSPSGPSTSPGRCAARPASGSASRSRRPGWRCPTAASRSTDELLGLIADEINVKEVEVIDDESALVERRVKPLLPKIGKRLGAAIPAVMAAARAGEVTFEADGSVTLAGVTLAPDEVEIQATPRPGTAVAHDDGLVVVIDTELTPGARRRGRRPRARAGHPGPAPRGRPRARRPDRPVGRRPVPTAVAPHLAGVAADTLADLAAGDAPADAPTRDRRARPAARSSSRCDAAAPIGRRHDATTSRARSPAAEVGHDRHEADRGALARLPRDRR